MKEARGAIAVLAVAALLLVAGCASAPDSGRYSSPEKASQANARLGASYLQTGNLRRADAKLRKALRQDSSNPDAHTAFALLNMELGKPDVARKHFERALDLAPDSPQVKNNYGTFLCNQGDHDRGIALFLEAADNRLYDTPAYAYANAGRCALDAGRAGEARDYLRQSLERDPRLPSALRLSAELALDRGRAEQASEYYERLLGVAEQNADSLWLGVRIARALGNRQAAKEYGVRLLQDYRDSKQAQLFLDTRTR